MFLLSHRTCSLSGIQLTVTDQELDTLPDSDQQGISHVWSLFSAAPSKHRNLMLQGILAQCCFPQLSFIAANVRDLIKIDFLSVLPAELGLKVLCYLDPTSICKAAQVSRRWRLLADDDVVWHRMCEQHIDRKCTKCGWGLPLLDRKRLRTEKRQIQLRASGHHDLDNGSSGDAASRDHQHQHDQLCGVSNSSSPKSGKKRVADVSKEDATASKELKRRRGSPSTEEKAIRKTQAWKDVYRDRFRIGTNWKYGRCTVQTFRGHTNGVMCVQFDENVIVSGSYDSTVKIWDIETGKEVRTLTGHTLGVRSLKFDDSKLMTASLDKTVKIWSMETGQHLRTLTGHTDGVLCVDFDKHVVASGSKDHTIRVWNFSTKAVTALRGHSEWVNCVKLDLASRTLLSASDDCTIRLWDLDTSRCLKVYTGHVAQVQQVVPMPRGFEPEFYEPVPTEEAWKWGEGSEARTPPPRYMMTGALSGNIRMWDTYTGRCIKTFFGHIEGVWGLTADTLRVVSGANDGMVKVWDPRTGACERTFTGHAGPVTCVGLSDRRMCSGSEDHEVRLYNFCA